MSVVASLAALAVAVLAVRRKWFVPTPPTRLGRLDRRGAITLARVEPPSPDQRVDTSSSARRCPECTGPNDFLEFRRTMDLGCDALGDFVPVRMRFAHLYHCKRCGFDCRWETTRAHPDISTENRY